MAMAMATHMESSSPEGRRWLARELSDEGDIVRYLVLGEGLEYRGALGRETLVTTAHLLFLFLPTKEKGL